MQRQNGNGKKFQQFRSRVQRQWQLRNGRMATAQRNGETAMAERQNGML